MEKVLIKGFDTCNRTACQVPLGERKWFNTSTRWYYCYNCMIKITSWPENMNIFENHSILPKLNLEQCGY